MFQLLAANTADQLWGQAAKLLLQDGLATHPTGRGGATLEVMNVAFTLQDARQRWISSRTPAMNPAFAIAEVVWMVCGRNDSKMLNYFNPILPSFAGDGETYHGAYGHRIRTATEFDQLDRAYHVLRNNPESRQAVLQIWNSELDFPNKDGTPTSKDTPCNLCSLLKVRDGKLVWTQIMRSNDLFRGFPHNVIQFSTLQEILAGWLGLEMGSYHHYSDSLHFYQSDGNIHSHLVEVPPPTNSDSLSVPRGPSDSAFKELAKLCDLCASQNSSFKEIGDFFSNLHLPKGHFNLACVLFADALRRRGLLDETKVVIDQCSNPCLAFMFHRWLEKDRPCNK